MRTSKVFCLSLTTFVVALLLVTLQPGMTAVQNNAVPSTMTISAAW